METRGFEPSSLWVKMWVDGWVGVWVDVARYESSFVISRVNQI